MAVYLKRIYPRRIQDVRLLSQLLDQYLEVLQTSPLQVSLPGLAYETRIPEAAFITLAALHRNPDEAPPVVAADFHTVFSNVMFRYPTVRIWQTRSGAFFIEC